MVRLTYEHVFNYFKEHNCELLETEYINCKTKMKFKCSCGNISYIKWNDFHKGSRCMKCGKLKSCAGQIFKYDYVANYFKEHNCELLEKEYVNSRKRMKFKCECGNVSFITFHSFKNGHRCKQCGFKKIVEKKTLSYDYVFNYFKESGCELLSKEYKLATDKLEYKCECGNIDYISFDNFQHGHRCFKCGLNKISEAKLYSFDYISDYVKSFGYTILSEEYTGCLQYLNLLCPNGHPYKTTFSNFQSYRRCSICSGSNGEKRIANYLINNNIKFEQQYRIKDCKNKRALPFDFAILDNENLNALIEFDGEQHFKTRPYFGDVDKYEKTKLHDTIKNTYCQKNNVPLLRIPYTEFTSIEIILDNFLSNFN
jgi:effector-binding domain-containing protein